MRRNVSREVQTLNIYSDFKGRGKVVRREPGGSGILDSHRRGTAGLILPHVVTQGELWNVLLEMTTLPTSPGDEQQGLGCSRRQVRVWALRGKWLAGAI